LCVLVVPRRVAARAAEELSVNPEFSGLLLGERVRAEHRAERRPGGARIGAAEVVPLAAAAVIEDRRSAVRVAHVRELGRALGDRRVPVDLLEGSVGAAAQRRAQPVATVLVVVEALRLLARIALGRGMHAVAADARDVPALGLDLDAAVLAAEDAGR